MLGAQRRETQVGSSLDPIKVLAALVTARHFDVATSEAIPMPQTVWSGKLTACRAKMEMVVKGKARLGGCPLVTSYDRRRPSSSSAATCFADLAKFCKTPAGDADVGRKQEIWPASGRGGTRNFQTLNTISILPRRGVYRAPSARLHAPGLGASAAGYSRFVDAVGHYFCSTGCRAREWSLVPVAGKLSMREGLRSIALYTSRAMPKDGGLLRRREPHRLALVMRLLTQTASPSRSPRRPCSTASIVLHTGPWIVQPMALPYACGQLSSVKPVGREHAPDRAGSPAPGDPSSWLHTFSGVLRNIARKRTRAD
ncbi:hypothetical protein B0H13DRAFT_2357936 [Mycena leptocephala]|nr:hypothetical protein B0H13DRAFT_2357936 [Mycena leptocephala]